MLSNDNNWSLHRCRRWHWWWCKAIIYEKSRVSIGGIMASNSSASKTSWWRKRVENHGALLMLRGILHGYDGGVAWFGCRFG